jgi:hypothetical protein
MTEENIVQLTQRIERLEKAVFGKSGFQSKQKDDTAIPVEINFSLNERAFVKRYAADKSGPKKFTLLLAYLTKGKVGENITLADIKKHWNKMKAKSLLGQFNMFYPNDAKTHGWVDSKEYGSYTLTKEWEGVL